MRLKEIDFLRGIAIILVICRHQYLSDFTTKIGWTGVDLFFVLSGFLVSGLLFKEYKKYGKIEPVRFLIRRGFKIYPIYYLFYLPYIIPLIIVGQFKFLPFLSDMFFIQNYVNGWGYAYGPSWSLAVEEHFYFGLAFLFMIITKYKSKMNFLKKISFLQLGVAFLFLILFVRIFHNIYNAEDVVGSIVMTHLRIDSLFFGVLISYLFHYKLSKLNEFYIKHKYKILILIIPCLIWVPFFNYLDSFFAKTFGLTLLYIGFGLLLILFLLTNNIKNILDKIFTKYLVNFISKVGYCSYSIYVIHIFCIMFYHHLERAFNFQLHQKIGFTIVFSLCIVSGFLMTYFVENYFLKLRNKYFPSRAI